MKRSNSLENVPTLLLIFLTVLVIAVESNIVYWKIGPFTVSAYMTLLTPLLLVLYLLSIMPRRRTLIFGEAWMLAPFLALLFVGASSLALEFRLEGLQNVLAWSVFVLGILAFMWGPERVIRPTVEIVLPAVGTLVGALFIATQIIDTETRFGVELFSPRQYSMVALISLAAAVSSPRRGLVFSIAPFIIFASVVFSASRTTTAVSLVMLLSLAQSDLGNGRALLKKLATLGGIVASVFAISAFLVRDVQERIGAGGLEQTVITSDSGRIKAWGQFLRMPETTFDWVFGLGSGATAEFGQQNIPFFPQTLNEYLRFLIDNGAVGLALFLSGIMVILYKLGGWNATSNTKAGALVISALSIVALTDGPFYSYFVVLPASLVVGNALRQSHRSTRGQVMFGPEDDARGG